MSGPGLELGQFPVRGTAGEAEAFCQATGVASGGSDLPLSFPMRWLATAEIRGALAALVGHGEVVLVHEGQSFTYERPLQVGQPYVLTLVVRREHAPDRLILEGTLTDGDRPCGALETTLRLVAAPVSA